MAAIYFRQQVLPAIYKIGHVTLPALIDQVAYRVFTRRLPQKSFFLLGTLAGMAGLVVLTPKLLRTVALGVYLSYKALQVYLLYHPKASSKPHVNRQKLIGQLWTAVEKGRLKIAEELWTQDPTLLDEVDENGWTLLHYGVIYGQDEMIEAIWLQAPHLLQKVDNEGNTPLHNAAACGELEILKWLDSKDPSLLKKRNNDDQSVLDLAAFNGCKAMSVWILDKDATMLTANWLDRTPFHAAAQKGHLEVLEKLWKINPTLLKHADINGDTPLHVAANEDRLKVAQWICSKSPDQVTVKNAAGCTPYQVAMRYEHFELAEWLNANHSASSTNSL